MCVMVCVSMILFTFFFLYFRPFYLLFSSSHSLFEFNRRSRQADRRSTSNASRDSFPLFIVKATASISLWIIIRRFQVGKYNSFQVFAPWVVVDHRSRVFRESAPATHRSRPAIFSGFFFLPPSITCRIRILTEHETRYIRSFGLPILSFFFFFQSLKRGSKPM